MTTDSSAAAPSAKSLLIAWASLLPSSPLIAAALYYFGDSMRGKTRLPAAYETWILAGGLAGAFICLPFLWRFYAATEFKPGEVRDAAYWQQIGTAMMIGITIADIPFLIGLTGYLAGGYLQTAIILLVVTVALQCCFKPPRR